jgi:small conductance mechanosensitive channel
MKFVVILFAAGFIGFEVSSLLGVLAAAGFAIGLALQGFLGNFASGITIVFFKPYGVGDWVEVADKFGKVDSIQIFNTTITTPGGKTLIIPNGQVTDGVITNFSTKGQIKLELNVTIPYEESFPKVKPIILDALSTVSEVLSDPAPDVGIESYDSHNVVLAVRPSIHPDDFWQGTFACYEAIKKAFNANGIKVAYSEGVELGPIGE